MGDSYARSRRIRNFQLKKIVVKIVLVCVLAVGIKWIWEKSLDASCVELKLGTESLTGKTRLQLGQNLAMAFLSGFRGVTADFMWLRAYDYWETKTWVKLKECVELATLLQPHATSFWDIGSWHMAWNASYAESVNENYLSKAYRLKMEREWVDAGRAYLERGIENNPSDWNLWFKMGWIFYQKYRDPLGAVSYFKKAAARPDAPLYVRRMVGHSYTKAGKIREAYEWWKKLWAEDHHLQPGELWYKIAAWGREAENELKIPMSQRIFPQETVFPSDTEPSRVTNRK